MDFKCSNETLRQCSGQNCEIQIEFEKKEADYVTSIKHQITKKVTLY